MSPFVIGCIDTYREAYSRSGMNLPQSLVLFVVALVGGFGAPRAALQPMAAAEHLDLSGTWTLNGGQSDMPVEVGFDPDWVDTETTTGARGGSSGGSGGQSSGGGGRGGARSSGGGGGRSSGGSGTIQTLRESEEDSKKIRELVADVKHPPASLTITQTDAAITIAPASGPARTYHLNGKEETVRLESGAGVGSLTKWEPAGLVVRYLVAKNRELRFTFARTAGARRLVVSTQFVERGKGQIIKRVYE